MQDNEKMMRRAIELARLGQGFTAPNPMVGAVIVKAGRIIGEGYHHRCGELHAERNAFLSLTEPAEGADMFVTLEPCCHFGRTPPCTQAIIEHKIGRVFIGSRDPNPLVSGKGAKILREHGIEVVEDFLREECDSLNPVFFHYITTKTPYVVLKYAMTADGKIASRTGASKWITGETARRHVHQLRGVYSAILAGIGTVLADDPMLNCRNEGAHQPLRVIVDSHLRIPLDSRICRSAKEYPTLVACGEENEEKRKKLEEAGISVACLPSEDGRVDLRALMKYLAEKDISSVFIEGGGEIAGSALASGIVSHVCAYIAPMLMGGKAALCPVGDPGADCPDNAVLLSSPRITELEGDLLLEYDIKRGMR